MVLQNHITIGKLIYIIYNKKGSLQKVVLYLFYKFLTLKLIKNFQNDSVAIEHKKAKSYNYTLSDNEMNKSSNIMNNKKLRTRSISIKDQSKYILLFMNI